MRLAMSTDKKIIFSPYNPRRNLCKHCQHLTISIANKKIFGIGFNPGNG